MKCDRSIDDVSIPELVEHRDGNTVCRLLLRRVDGWTDEREPIFRLLYFAAS